LPKEKNAAHLVPHIVRRKGFLGTLVWRPGPPVINNLEEKIDSLLCWHLLVHIHHWVMGQNWGMCRAARSSTGFLIRTRDQMTLTS
jgi:hypothetical protein